MSGYIGSKTSVTLVDGYTQAEADAEFVQDPNGAITVSGSNVGIGTSSPSNTLSLEGSGTGLNINSTNDEVKKIAFENSGVLTGYIGSSTASPLRFLNGSATERMRIDSSGNLLVGTTDNNVADNSGISNSGFNVRSSGRVLIAEPENAGLWVNRLGNDGDIAVFRKDGTTVGSIGVAASDNFYLAGGSGSTKGIYFNEQGMLPANTGGALINNAVDIGKNGFRFKDIYATNGTIQTSDANEKQDVAALTATEMLVAARISGLFKTFRWIDSVADKGDNARTHTGVMAQDVQAAFTAEGLDAGDYALFISATWWETQTDVAAVEADEDNEIEAADAYTRTDTYDTLDEAPEGATEVTSMGIRYPELLSFVGAYNEQRFASIETRLAALEAV